MILYHFTSVHHINGCRAHGLRLGMVPLSLSPPRFLGGYQWLTVSPQWVQSWCEDRIAVRYDRSAFRITIDVPRSKRQRLLRWTKVCHKLTPMHADLNAFGDPENWRLFRGVVRPEWFVTVEYKRDTPKVVA